MRSLRLAIPPLIARVCPPLSAGSPVAISPWITGLQLQLHLCLQAELEKHKYHCILDTEGHFQIEDH